MERKKKRKNEMIHKEEQITTNTKGKRWKFRRNKEKYERK